MKKLLLLIFTTLIAFSGFSQVLLDEDFNSGIPATWTVVDGGNTTDTWNGTSGGLLGQYLDGTEFAIVNSDAAGNLPAVRLTEELITPAVNTTSLAQVLLEFDHRYQDVFLTDSAWVDVFDGTSWNTVRAYNANVGNWGAPAREVIDITAFANAACQVRFRYDDDSTWAWHWSVDNVKIWAPFGQDAVAFSAPDPPRAGCGLDSNEVVTIIFYNNGTDTLASADVGYTINGLPGASETVAGPILPGDTITYTFTTTANLSVPGIYNFAVYTDLSSDQDMTNDTVSFSVENFNPITTFPYFEDFEGGPGGWFSGGIGNTWAFGTPAKATITGAASGINAWVTGGLGTGQYVNNEDSYIEAPCFDFSGIANPWISLSIWWNSEFSWDGAMIETSVDNGLTWNRIGNFGDPFNWYNDNTIAGLPNGQGWTGTASFNGSAGWVSAKHPLTGLGGQPTVKVRIYFGSDGSVTDDGVAIDNVLIYEPPAFDAQALNILSPISGCQLTNQELVTFNIFNNGLDTLANFPAFYSINGNTPVPDTVPGPIFPGDTLPFTFTPPADLSTPGSYTVVVYTAAQGDTLNFNDTTSVTIVNIAPITTFPYFEDFESGPGNWLAGGAASSWAFGTPAKLTIQGAASGANAWVTGGLGTTLYNNNEKSFVVSPCMDFTSMTNPWIAMDVWWESENSFDGAVLEATTDNGITWLTIGQVGDPFNWYNDSSIFGMPNQIGWTGTIGGNGSGTWVPAKHDLSAIANQPSVTLRIFFGSDGSITDDGFAFDNVAIGDPPTVSAGPDTALCNPPYVLDAGTQPGTYEWSTGDTTASISVDSSGTYIVTYTDSIGLCALDTVVVTFDPAIPVITGDTSYCENDTATLSTTQSFASYSWSSGGSAQTEFITSPGQIIVDVVNASGCTGSDTVDVIEFPAPQPNVSQNPEFCTGDTLVLSTDTTWTTYNWSTGGTQRSENITAGGSVTVTVTDGLGCGGSTTITVVENPLPIVDLGPDTTLCDGASITLSGSDPTATYIWSTGQTTQSISVTLAGDYILTCTDLNNCTADDTLGVTAFVSPSANFGFDTTNCPTVVFTDQSLGNPNSWSWTFGDGGTSTSQSPTHVYAGGGQFNVTLTATNGCGTNDITKLVNIGCLIGIDEALLGRVAIYPNPNEGWFQIGFEDLQADRITLEVTDLSGKILLDEELDQTSGTFRKAIDLRAYARGAYLLKLDVDGHQAIWRILTR